MTIQELIDSNYFDVLTPGQGSRTISKVFCCDLLSIAMSKAPADCAWVTVMGNRNTLAVSSLADVACIVLAEGVALGEAEIACAKDEGIAVFATELPIFDAAVKIYELESK